VLTLAAPHPRIDTRNWLFCHAPLALAAPRPHAPLAQASPHPRALQPAVPRRPRAARAGLAPSFRARVSCSARRCVGLGFKLLLGYKVVRGGGLERVKENKGRVVQSFYQSFLIYFIFKNSKFR
jgi:hypothetical protein